MPNNTPSQIGRYEIQSRIGAGGMGQVFAAWDPRLSRSVAIKMILNRHLANEVARQRFEAEARALAAITDPHVVRIYDFDSEADSPWLVMERVSGRTLRQVVANDGRPSAKRLHDWALQTLAGLAAAHHAGVIHRDVKPSNVVLTEQGTCVLLDFGLAEVADDDTDLTNSGEVVGTIRYLSPSRLRGGPATAQSDCHALGISLFELAVAERVYPDMSPAAIMQAIVTQGAPDLATERPDLSPEWLAWFTKLCAPEGAPAFADAGEALTALRRLTSPSDYQVDETVVGAATLGTVGNESTASNPTAAPVTGGVNIGVRETSVSVSATVRPSSAVNRVPLVSPPATNDQRRRPRLRFVVKLVLALWVLSTASALVSGLLISRAAIERQTEQLRAAITSAAQAAAQLIDGDEHAALVALGDAAGDHPSFTVISDRLRRFHEAWPEVTYIYTMTQLPDSESAQVVAFVVDASPEIDENENGVIDPDEANADPGDRYSFAEAPDLFTGFSTATADQQPTSDQWGTWISGYAPILTTDGVSTGLVGIDLSINVVDELKRDFYLQSMILIASSLVAFIAAGWLVAWRLRRPVKLLRDSMTALADGNLDASMVLNSGDEFDEVADAYEVLRTRLVAAAALRQGYERFAASALYERGGRRQAAAPRQEAWMALRLPTDAVQRAAASSDGTGEHDSSHELERLFGRIHDLGGLVAEVGATHVLIRFPANHPEDLPTERALRCGLLVLSPDQQWPVPSSIVVGVGEASAPSAQSVRDLVALLDFGIDLVATPEAFKPIASTFIADAVDRDGALVFYAIKAAISAG